MTTPPKSLITFLFVTDLEASHRFYADALDLPMVLDQGNCRIYRINRGAFLGICERPDRVGACAVSHINSRRE